MVGAAMAPDSAALERAAKLVIVGTQLACQAREDGDVWTLAWLYDLPDGRRVVVYRMAFGNARLCVGPAGWLTYDAGYCYSGVDVAIVAAVQWIAAGAEGEPDDWKKNLQTGEFREPA
jgi:hypothetical protein